ncbi:hypothetical protein D3C83_109340 [compost metagenome]
MATVIALAISGGGGAPFIIGIAVLMALVVVAFGYLVEAPTPEPAAGEPNSVAAGCLPDQ